MPPAAPSTQSPPATVRPAVEEPPPRRRLAAVLGRLDRQWALVASLAVAAWALMVRTRVRDGISVTPDGRRYLERAEAIADGDLAFSTITSRPLHFPPLYPALVALVDRTTPFGPEGAAVAINVLAVVAAVIGVDRLARHVLTDPPLPLGWRALLPIALLGTGDMVAGGGAVLSDFVFLALFAWISVLLVDHLRGGRTAPLAVMTALAALAVLSRYAAAFLVVGVVLVVAWSEVTRRRVPWRAAGVAAVALGPTVLWYAWARGRGAAAPGDETAHGAIGELTFVEALLDSFVGWGAKLIGVAQRRVGNYLGRSTFSLPGLADAMPAIALVLAVVSLGAVVAGLWRTRDAWRWGFRAADPASGGARTGDAAERARGAAPAGPPVSRATATAVWAVALPAAVYLGLLFAYRASTGFFVIQRYLALVPVVAWLVVAVLARRRDGWTPVLTASFALATMAGFWGAFLSLRL